MESPPIHHAALSRNRQSGLKRSSSLGKGAAYDKR
jgi:hypothetical protein